MYQSIGQKRKVHTFLQSSKRKKKKKKTPHHNESRKVYTNTKKLVALKKGKK